MHAPITGRLPDLASYTYGVCESPDGTRPEHFLVAVLDWATKEAALSALASPEGQEATGDLANSAQAGASPAFADVETVI